MVTRPCKYMRSLHVNNKIYTYYAVAEVPGSDVLPYSLTVLLENVLRNAPNAQAAEKMAQRIVKAGSAGTVGSEIEFSPARVLFQDFTGVPVFVDFAIMREACASLGGKPSQINPQVPCDLVIDHSVIADEASCSGALNANMDLEFRRNHERYDFLKWAQNSFNNVRIVPPGAGICHQLNIEKFARGVMTSDEVKKNVAQEDVPVAYFDTLVGTDSHTPTANGIGVLGWGVGGIEAEAAALGQPITTLVPRVVGVHLSGELAPEIAALDVALTFAQVLRAKGVVGSFVECFGPGLQSLSATQRTCIANMTPEYGSTCTLFPIDEQTLAYLRLTGRSEKQVLLVEAYARAQGFWNDPHALPRKYAEVIELNLSEVGLSLAGPSRPHDRIDLSNVQRRFQEVCKQRNLYRETAVQAPVYGVPYMFSHGTLAIAAVTSCTTATDPAMMLAAGLLATKAAKAGLVPKPWVKCILAPGSKATELLLERAGLVEGLRQLGFYTCGFGCMSCIGNSGPILDSLHAISGDIELASILSGNRNFEGRISPDVSQNYLAAPALVIAYALVGTIDVDIVHDVLGYRGDGSAVYLRDIWPHEDEIRDLIHTYVDQDLYEQGSKNLYEGDQAWQALGRAQSDTFIWDDSSTYVRRAPYFEGMTSLPPAFVPITNAVVLALFGDFITTDHISPAGSIALDSPAAQYLEKRGVLISDFNTYGARRGNHEVMMRGTFANTKLVNLLADGQRGGLTRNADTAAIEPIYNASCYYSERGIAQVVLAGKMYGSGSSRDWAAKGPKLLGVRAVIAESFERIHRSNLVGMGILPLQFLDGQSVESLGLSGKERFSIAALDFADGLPSPSKVAVKALRDDGSMKVFEVQVRIDTPTEGAYFAHGGILPYVVRQLTARV